MERKKVKSGLPQDRMMNSFLYHQTEDVLYKAYERVEEGQIDYHKEKNYLK